MSKRSMMTLFEVKVKRTSTAASGVALPGQHHSQSERRRLVNLYPNKLGRPAVPVVRHEAPQPPAGKQGSNT